jgi:peptide/nickel transport system ATP-binding protein
MLLEVKDLNIYYKVGKSDMKVLDNFNLTLDKGQIISIVGESGSGKSTFGYALAGLLPANGRSEGFINYSGTNIVNLTDNEMTSLRGTSIFMIFQNPLNSLNPVKNVESQLLDALKIRIEREGKVASDEEMRTEIIDVMKKLRFPDPENIITRYPHELSGGQVQRTVIAMALLLKPKILIADEPTTALDVTIQAQVVELLRELNKTMETSIIFITHDIGLAYVISSQILVFYAGRLMEQSTSESLIKKPLHPYTAGLLASIPNSSKGSGSLFTIKGSPPSFLSLPNGCKFWPRCHLIIAGCDTNEPNLIDVNENKVRCWLYG